MNKISISLQNILWLILLLFLLISCKKEKSDYRNSYIGIWSFKVDRTEINTDSIGYYYHDSLVYEGEIVCSESENEITIKYTCENTINLTLSTNGELSNFPSHYCNGEFLSIDSLNLHLKWGGLGGGTTHQIQGVKK